MYAIGQWAWRKRIAKLEVANEPELEQCWSRPSFVEQTLIRWVFSNHFV